MGEVVGLKEKKGLGLSERELERIVRYYERSKRYSRMRLNLLSVIWGRIGGEEGLRKGLREGKIVIELGKEEIKEILG